MEPISATLAAIGLLMNQQNQANAMGTAADNLSFQRQQAANQERLVGATKVDANGNKTVYDPATNTWKVVLTPMQQAIQDASQSEQLQTVTTDAARKRDLANRQQQYSEDAGTPYNEAIQKFIHQQPKSEGAINNDLETLGIQANQSGAKSNQADLVKQALRLGRGGDINQIIKSTDDKTGAGTADVMLNARQQAMQEAASRIQQHNQQYLPEIQQWKQIIDAGGGGASSRFSDLSPQVAASESASNNAMLTALQGANSGINSASANLVKAEGSKVDFSQLIKALSAGKTGANTDWDKRPTKVDYSTTPDYLNDISYGRQDSEGNFF